MRQAQHKQKPHQNEKAFVHAPRKVEIGQMAGHHITPWSQGGNTTKDNGPMPYRDCNRRKSGRWPPPLLASARHRKPPAPPCA